MSFLDKAKNDLEIARKVLFEETVSPSKSEYVLSEETSIKNFSLGLALIGDPTATSRKVWFFFTHDPRYDEELQELQSKLHEIDDESLLKKERIKIKTRKIFGWITFGLSIFPGILWFIIYIPLLLVVEFLPRLLENYLLQKSRENDSTSFKCLFMGVKIVRLVLGTITSPIQSIRAARRIDKDKYPKTRKALMCLSGILSTVLVTTLFFSFCWSILVIVGSSIATLMLPKFGFVQRVVIDMALNISKIAIPNIFRRTADVVASFIYNTGHKVDAFKDLVGTKLPVSLGVQGVRVVGVSDQVIEEKNGRTTNTSFIRRLLGLGPRQKPKVKTEEREEGFIPDQVCPDVVRGHVYDGLHQRRTPS